MADKPKHDRKGHTPKVLKGSVRAERGGLSFKLRCCDDAAHEMSGHIQNAGKMTDAEIEEYIERVMDEHAESHDRTTAIGKFIAKRFEAEAAEDSTCEDCK